MGAGASEPVTPTTPVCKVCCNNYNTGEHLPLLLPCCHTLCRHCVRKVLIGTTIRKCPGCADNHDSVSLEELKVNYALTDSSPSAPSQPGTPATTIKSQDGTIRLILKNFDDKEFPLKVSPSATISNVKEVIRDEHGFNPASTRLLFKGKVLKDNQTLEFYKVQRGNTLQMVTRYLGG